MNVGQLRKIIEGLDDNCPIIVATISSSVPDDDINVVLECLGPSIDNKYLSLQVSIVTDNELEPDDEPEDDEPDDEDATITDVPNHGYDVAAAEVLPGYGNDLESAVKILREWIEQNNYYPNVWMISDHGNATKITI